MERLRFLHLKCAILFFVLVMQMTHTNFVVDASRVRGNQRKTPTSNSNSGHSVTPATSYNNGGGGSGNSHADVAKLSYPNYNSQPNRVGTNNNNNNNPGQIGWNVPPNQHGPPPAYSASNPIGGAKTNINEPPPSYHQPNYGASNVHNTPITATNAHGTQYAAPPAPGGSYYNPGALPAGATYHSPGSLPPGATYHSAGSIPPGASYYPAGGHMPGYPVGGQLPAGSAYYPAGQIPAGATYYPQAPQSSSSGLGFGTGLIAGGLGGALLGHALTPTNTQTVQAAPAAGAGGAAAEHDRIIIINNGVPVNATDGVTVVNAGATPMTNTTQDATTTAQLAPFAAPAAAATGENNNSTVNQPAPGGIICVPVRVNETDPADSSKMIEVEKVACYPAPPQQQADAQAVNNGGTVPLAPMAQPAVDQAAVHANNSAMHNLQSYFGVVVTSTLLCLMANMKMW